MCINEMCAMCFCVCMCVMQSSLYLSLSHLTDLSMQFKKTTSSPSLRCSQVCLCIKQLDDLINCWNVSEDKNVCWQRKYGISVLS